MKRRMEVNTELRYLYRDASNYKQHGEVVLAGRMAESEAWSALWEEVYFIPSAVGLPDLQHLFREQGFPFPTEDDHPWHEMASIRPTKSNPTVALSAAELLRRLTECRTAGWESYLLAAETELRGESKSVP
jgi:hypothetical protein